MPQIKNISNIKSANQVFIFKNYFSYRNLFVARF